MMNPKRYPFRSAGISLLITLMSVISCKKNSNTNAPNLTPVGNYVQTNLVSNVTGLGAGRTDSALVNAWGLAINPKGIIWISANGTGATTVYDTSGNTLLNPVNMPFQGTANASAPSGIIFNPTTSFVIPSSQKKSLFIWATENGALEAWAGGDTATTTVVDNSAQGSVYKGIAMASVNGANYLYATDFHNGKINVFDQGFQPVPAIALNDPGIPANYGPFNIACFGGNLYVTYAFQKVGLHDDSAGPGHGFVDVYSPAGTLIKRFASQGPLNSPWALAWVPDNGFGIPAHSILVGNFGDGRINAFDSVGNLLGPLQSNGAPLAIEGLWAIGFGNVIPGANPDKLYFTAGPTEESQGLFGYLLNQH